jgi:hypothetical protein
LLTPITQVGTIAFSEMRVKYIVSW